MSKKYTKEELENMIPVFHLKPVSSTRTKCTLTLYVNKEERLSDDQLEVETPEEIKEKIGDNTLLIGQINEYVLIGKYCACNIPGNFLIENSTLPVYYLSIIYNRKFITGSLFNIFLYFKIDEETKQKMDTPQKYYKALMNGNFIVQCVPVDEDFIEKVRKYVEEDVMVKYSDEFVNTEDQDKLMDKVMDDINSEMENISQFLSMKPFDENEDKIPTQKNAFNKLNAMCDEPIFKKLLAYGLMMREKERIEEKCPDVDYQLPTNIINLKEIKENPEKLDQIMAERKQQMTSN